MRKMPALPSLLKRVLVASSLLLAPAGCGSLLDVDDVEFGNKGGAGATSSTGGTGGQVLGGGGNGASGASGASGGAGGALGGGGSGALGGGGSGGMGECVAPEDCPGVDTTCHYRTCDGAVCDAADADLGTVCAEDGGAVCDGQGACIECNDVNDCAPTWLCQAGDCVPPQCSNGQQDGTESDIDCGGMECAPCPNTLKCNAYADCFSNFCDALVCSPCINDGDCAAAGDSYCAGGSCTPKKVLGDSCGAGNQCLSGNCPSDDGVCCDDACGSTCEACLSVKTGSPNGTCDLVTTQTDPDTECADAGAAMCNSNGMGCTGVTNACIFYPNGAVCISPVCGAGQQTTAGQCNGTGTCNAGATSGCAPYVCNGAGTACLTMCGSDSDCLGTHYCDGAGVCQQKKVTGVACGTANECDSDNCPVDDGVCCDMACGGTCMACTAAATAGTDGACAPVTTGLDPDGECAVGQGCMSAGCDDHTVAFISSIPYTGGDFGGLTGADAECQTLASAAGLPGTFLAWMSDDNTSASDRFSHSVMPYERVDGMQIAADWADLTDSSIGVTMSLDESGVLKPVPGTISTCASDQPVWTGTETTGLSAQGLNCFNWTGGSNTRWGQADQTAAQWTRWCTLSGSCSSFTAHIYCFQQ